VSNRVFRFFNDCYYENPSPDPPPFTGRSRDCDIPQRSFTDFSWRVALGWSHKGTSHYITLKKQIFVVLKEDRVCIIIFICFNVCAMVLQALGLLIVYLGNTNDTVAQWILVMLIVEHIPFLYMIPIGVIEYRIIKETHLQIADNYSRSALRMSAPHAGQVPGLGF
jgi:hypothetical protein